MGDAQMSSGSEFQIVGASKAKLKPGPRWQSGNTFASHL